MCVWLPPDPAGGLTIGNGLVTCTDSPDAPLPNISMVLFASVWLVMGRWYFHRKLDGGTYSWASKHLIRKEWRVAISRTSQWSAEPLMWNKNHEKESRFLGTARFLLARVNLERRTGKFPWALSDWTQGFGRVDCSWDAGFTTHHGNACITLDLGTTVFLILHDATFEERGLVWLSWSGVESFALLLTALNVAAGLYH